MNHVKMDGPAVSVAMCSYNGARFLAAQLDSIRRQTILPAELVIQDDGSSDATPDIVERFTRAAAFPVRFGVNAQRKGPARNFEACLARCTGDIVILADQDDLWLPDRIERTIAAYRDADVTFTYADAPLIDDCDRLIGRTIFATVPVNRQDRHLLAVGGDMLPLILRYGVLYGATMSIRRDLIANATPFPDAWSHDEWLSLVGAAAGRAVAMAPVMRYRQHAAQVVGAGVAGLQAVLVGARHHSGHFYDAERTRYKAAIEAADRHPLLLERLSPHLAEKYAFLLARRIIHEGGIAGFRQAMIQIGRGNYARFASGMRSIAKDIAVAGKARISFGTRSSSERNS